MGVLDKNPYRVLGVFANTSESEILKQKTRLVRFLSVGKSEAAATDLPCLGEMRRTESDVEEAAKQIEQPQEKLLHSLMWFINHSPADGVAFEHLRNWDVDKAIGIWSLAVHGKEITTKNFSSCLNLSTILMFRAVVPGHMRQGGRLMDGTMIHPANDGNVDKVDLINAFRLKRRLLNSEGIAYIADIVVDGSLDGESSSLTGELEDQLSDRFAELVYLTVKRYLNQEFSAGDLIQTIREISPDMSEHLAEFLTGRQIKQIEAALAKAEERVTADKADAAKAGFEMFEAVREPLEDVQDTLGKSDITADTVRNNVANQLLNCSIAYFNEFLEDGGIDPGEDAYKLLKLAESLKPTGETASRIERNLPTIEKWRKGQKTRAATAVFIQRIRARHAMLQNSTAALTCSRVASTASEVAKIVKEAAGKKSELDQDAVVYLNEQGFGPLFDMTVDRINALQRNFGSIMDSNAGPFMDSFVRMRALEVATTLQEEVESAKLVIRLALDNGASGVFRKRLEENLRTLSNLGRDLSRMTGVPVLPASGQVSARVPTPTRAPMSPSVRASVKSEIPGWVWALGVVFAGFFICAILTPSPLTDSNNNSKDKVDRTKMKEFRGSLCRGKLGSNCSSKSISAKDVPCPKGTDCSKRLRLARLAGAGTMTLDSFLIDAFEVSRDEFYAYAQRARISYPPPLDIQRSYPAVNVTFDQAAGYCKSVGKRLPTEDEWEFAAREGGTWSWAPDGFDESRRGTSISRVWELPDRHHMIGNVAEWVEVAEDGGYPLPIGTRVVRGGSFESKTRPDAFTRELLPISTTKSWIGFRCAL